MNKKYILFILLLVCTLTLCGCNKLKSVEESKQQNNDIFRFYQHVNGGGDIIVDSQTKVMYWVSTNRVITLLVDSDGKPKLYDGEIK